MRSAVFPLVVHLLAVSPLNGTRPMYTECVGNSTYAANSFYEANLRRLAAALRAAASAPEGPYAYRDVGFWPNRVAASSMYSRRDDDAEDGRRYSAWAGCIAVAFRELESACPRHREAYFSGANCSLREWRDRKKRTTVLSAPLIA